MADLNVDFTQLHRAGTGVGSSADQSMTHLAALQSELAGHGEPWKDDPSPVGGLIGAIYGAISQAAQEAFHDNAATMGRQAENIHAMASGFQQSEDLSTIEVNNVRDVLG